MTDSRGLGAVRSRLLVACLAGFLGSVGGAPVAAQEAPSPPVQFTIEATAAGGPTGLAVVAASGADASVVQALVTGAPEDATAIIHAGSCAAPGAVVGIVGSVGEGGQAQATVPVPLETLTDGSHVLALHPGLELGETLACGGIPAVAIRRSPQPAPPTPGGTLAPPLPITTFAPAPVASAAPASVAPDPPAPVASAAPVADPACPPIREWIVATNARLDVLSKAQDEASAASRGSVQTFIATLATNSGILDTVLREVRLEDVPPEAAAANEKLAEALAIGLEVIELQIRAYTEADMSFFERAQERGKIAGDLIIGFRTTLGELEARCPAPG